MRLIMVAYLSSNIYIKCPWVEFRVVSENKEEYPEEVLTAQEMIDQEFLCGGICV